METPLCIDEQPSRPRRQLAARSRAARHQCDIAPSQEMVWPRTPYLVYIGFSVDHCLYRDSYGLDYIFLYSNEHGLVRLSGIERHQYTVLL